MIDFTGGAIGLWRNLGYHEPVFFQLLELSVKLAQTDTPNTAQFTVELLIELVAMLWAHSEQAQKGQIGGQISIARHREKRE
jgi:hypothetical protein